jgi:hypothetical protein
MATIHIPQQIFPPPSPYRYDYYYHVQLEILLLFISLPVSLWLFGYYFYPSHHQRVLNYQRQLVRYILAKFDVDHFPEFADQTWNEANGSFLGITTLLTVSISSSLTWIIEGRSSIAKLLPRFWFHLPYYILHIFVHHLPHQLYIYVKFNLFTC